MFIHNSHFCLIWKSSDNNFTQAIKELKPNFKVVDNVLCNKHGKSFFKNEYKPKKAQSSSTIIILYDLETFKNDRAVPFASGIYKLSKVSGKNHRDIPEKGYQKCFIAFVVFTWSDCVYEMLDCVLSYKGEPKKVNNKVVKNNLYLIVHERSGFDTCVVLNILRQWRSVVSLITNGAGIVSSEIFNGYLDEKKNTSICTFQMRFFACERFFKKELKHDEIYEDTWEEKESESLPYPKSDVSSTAFSYARYILGVEELTGFGLKNNSTLPSLANKNFNNLREENDELIYTYNDESMRNFARKSTKNVDMVVSINIIGHLFQKKCLIKFQKN